LLRGSSNLSIFVSTESALSLNNLRGEPKRENGTLLMSYRWLAML
jgi:hypothetical protein